MHVCRNNYIMYIIPFCYVCNVFKELQVCSAWGGYKDTIVQPLTQVVSQKKGIKIMDNRPFAIVVHMINFLWTQKQPALVKTTFQNFQGGALQEIWQLIYFR